MDGICKYTYSCIFQAVGNWTTNSSALSYMVPSGQSKDSMNAIVTDAMLKCGGNVYGENAIACGGADDGCADPLPSMTSYDQHKVLCNDSQMIFWWLFDFNFTIVDDCTKYFEKTVCPPDANHDNNTLVATLVPIGLLFAVILMAMKYLGYLDSASSAAGRHDDQAPLMKGSLNYYSPG